VEGRQDRRNRAYKGKRGEVADTVARSCLAHGQYPAVAVSAATYWREVERSWQLPARS
jgi:hypothetical protein